jgi:hypothetical protein
MARFTSTATAVASFVAGPADTPPEEVVVTAFRASLKESLDAKRENEPGDFLPGDSSVSDINIQPLTEEPPRRWSRAGFQGRGVAIANDKSGGRKS